MLGAANVYVADLAYDKAYEGILFDGISLKDMSAPVARLKKVSGLALDFLYARGGKLVVSEHAKAFLQQLEERSFFEFVEVQFKNGKLPSYYVLNILDLVDAFDWERSEYELFDELGPKGNKVIRNLIKMEIDEHKTNKRRLFSMQNYQGNTFMHVDLADEMIAAGITGLLLDPLVGHP